MLKRRTQQKRRMTTMMMMMMTFAWVSGISRSVRRAWITRPARDVLPVGMINNAFAPVFPFVAFFVLFFSLHSYSPPCVAFEWRRASRFPLLAASRSITHERVSHSFVGLSMIITWRFVRSALLWCHETRGRAPRREWRKRDGSTTQAWKAGQNPQKKLNLF